MSVSNYREILNFMNKDAKAPNANAIGQTVFQK